MSRLYFLRKLRSFNVCSKMLEIFYQSVVASALFFAAVCWGGSITSRLNKLIKKAGSVIGIKLDPFEAVVERRTLNRLLTIMEDNPPPSPPAAGQTAEILLQQTAAAPLSQGQIQETIPALCNNSL